MPVTQLPRHRRAGVSAPTLVGAMLGSVLLAQSLPTCTSQEALLGQDTNQPATGSQPRVFEVDSGRPLTTDELAQLIGETPDGRFTIVFINPTPGQTGATGEQGQSGESGSDGAMGATGATGAQGPQGLPGAPARELTPLVGEVRMWLGQPGTAPEGWLPCDGRAISRTAYARLFAVIGDFYGAGDQLGAFNVPDFRNRAPMGATLGAAAGKGVLSTVEGNPKAAGGSAYHTLSIAEMPIHDHDMTHTHSATPDEPGLFDFLPVATTTGKGKVGDITTNGPTPNITGPAGGGEAHSVLDPYFAVSYIVYTGAK